VHAVQPGGALIRVAPRRSRVLGGGWVTFEDGKVPIGP
jgi:hypothetical protein